MKNTLKVVLADDEALIRLDIREMLTEAGHEVAGEANNGEDAVAMTRALQPDLVIMDVKVPRRSASTIVFIFFRPKLVCSSKTKPGGKPLPSSQIFKQIFAVLLQ